MKEQKKYRNFALVIYPKEDVTHKKALEYIIKNYNHAYITHDKDILDTGEIKKEHTHIVIHFDNPRYKSAVAKELQIQENYIENCNIEKYLLYLIHYNNEEKHQYSINDVKGDLIIRLKELIEESSKTETEKVKILIDKTIHENLSLLQLTYYAIENGLYKTLKSNNMIISKIIDKEEMKRRNKKNEYC